MKRLTPRAAFATLALGVSLAFALPLAASGDPVQLGFLEICVDAADVNGSPDPNVLAQAFSFIPDVGPVSTFQCSGPFQVAAGTVHVVEQVPAGFDVTDIYGIPEGVAANPDAATADVLVPVGSFPNDEVSVHFVNVATTTNSAVPANGTASAGPSMPTAASPVGTSITTPNAGTIAIATAAASGTPPPGYVFAGQQVVITAPLATVQDPLRLTFTLDASLGTSIVIFRDNLPIAPCNVAGNTDAAPDPCYEPPVAFAGGTKITARTSHASTWNFGQAVLPPTRADQCKQGGWQNFARMFKNQGDCVSYVATKGKNPRAG